MARLAASGVALALLALAALAAGAGEASAHPLGALSVNRYARVEVSAEVARVHYVVDLAEIPAYRARRAVDADPDGYLARRVADAKEGLELTVDGRRLDLATVDRELNRPRGDGGVRRVRIDAAFEGRLPPSQPDEVLSARVTDRNQPERVGWREIVVAAAGDATVVSSSVPSAGTSDALRDYPDRCADVGVTEWRGPPRSSAPGCCRCSVFSSSSRACVPSDSQADTTTLGAATARGLTRGSGN